MQEKVISIDRCLLSSVTGARNYWVVKDKAELDRLVAAANRAQTAAPRTGVPFIARVLEAVVKGAATGLGGL